MMKSQTVLAENNPLCLDQVVEWLAYALMGT